MSNEFSELIALTCPDLTENGGSQILIDPRRRLSVKQMTATELAATRAAAAAEIETALHKAAEIAKAVAAAEIETALHKAAEVAIAVTSKFTKEMDTYAVQKSSSNPSCNLISKSTTSLRTSSKEISPLHVTIRNHLPRTPAPRDRIVSLPNVLDDISTASKNIQTSLQQRSIESLLHATQTIEASVQCSTSKLSVEEEYETASSSNSYKIEDSIELLRIQRQKRDRDRSLSPQSKSSATGDINALRQQRERSAAPDRLHSSSISSIGSAASASASASVSVSVNASRRGSTASNIGDSAPVIGSYKTAPTIPPTTAAAVTFPLSKTISVPNLERRRSSLSALFPGPSPLVAPEPILHTQPKVQENNKPDVKEPEIQRVQDYCDHERPTGKAVHRTKTPPPVGVSLGVNLKKVSPPRTHITVKKNEGPMLGVVLRKVEKKIVQQKSILDDDKPLYHLSIVRTGGESKENKPMVKPKPKPTALQKSATSTAVPAKPNPGGILTGPQVIRTVVNPSQQQIQKLIRPQPGVPITIQKIEGDKIIIIKKFIVPKNGKIPEQYLKVGDFVALRCVVTLVYVEISFG